MSDYHFVYVYILALRVFFSVRVLTTSLIQIYICISAMRHFSFLINNIF